MVARYDFKKLPTRAEAFGTPWPSGGIGLAQLAPLNSRTSTWYDNAWYYRPIPFTPATTQGQFNYVRLNTTTGTVLVASGSDNTFAISSDNGATWTSKTLPTGYTFTGSPTNGVGTGGTTIILVPAVSPAGVGTLYSVDATFTTFTSVLTMGTAVLPRFIFYQYNGGTSLYWNYVVASSGTVYASTNAATSGTWSSQGAANLLGGGGNYRYNGGTSTLLIGQNLGVLKYFQAFGTTVTTITSPFSGTYDVKGIGSGSYISSGSLVAVTAGGEIAYSSQAVSGAPTTWTLGVPLFPIGTRGLHSVRWYSGNVGIWGWAFLTTDGHLYVTNYATVTGQHPIYSTYFPSGSMRDITPGGPAGPPLTKIDNLSSMQANSNVITDTFELLTTVGNYFTGFAVNGGLSNHIALSKLITGYTN